MFRNLLIGLSVLIVGSTSFAADPTYLWGGISEGYMVGFRRQANRITKLGAVIPLTCRNNLNETNQVDDIIESSRTPALTVRRERAQRTFTFVNGAGRTVTMTATIIFRGNRATTSLAIDTTDDEQGETCSVAAIFSRVKKGILVR